MLPEALLFHQFNYICFIVLMYNMCLSNSCDILCKMVDLVHVVWTFANYRILKLVHSFDIKKVKDKVYNTLSRTRAHLSVMSLNNIHYWCIVLGNYPHNRTPYCILQCNTNPSIIGVIMEHTFNLIGNGNTDLIKIACSWQESSFISGCIFH